MEDYTTDFSVAVQGVKGFCPAGEAYAKSTRTSFRWMTFQRRNARRLRGRWRIRSLPRYVQSAPASLQPDLTEDWSWKGLAERRTQSD